jgi:hypothetical protein
VEIDHLKDEVLSPKVGLILEGGGQVDLSEGFGLFPRHDTVKRRLGRSYARLVDAHGIKHLDVHDVEAATSIHQHLAKTLLVDDRIDNEWVLARMQNIV